MSPVRPTYLFFLFFFRSGVYNIKKIRLVFFYIYSFYLSFFSFFRSEVYNIKRKISIFFMFCIMPPVRFTYLFLFFFQFRNLQCKKKYDQYFFMFTMYHATSSLYLLFFSFFFFRSGIYNIKNVRLVSIFFIYLLCIALPVHYTYFFFFFFFQVRSLHFRKKIVSNFLSYYMRYTSLHLPLFLFYRFGFPQW